MPTQDAQAKLQRWETELQLLTSSVSWRWGETRRFHSNHRKLGRISWLIEHIAAVRAAQVSDSLTLAS